MSPLMFMIRVKCILSQKRDEGQKENQTHSIVKLMLPFFENPIKNDDEVRF